MDNSERKVFGGSRSFSDDIDFLFDTMLCRGRPISMPSKGMWHPPMDVLETEKEYIIILEIAGIRREDVKLTFEAGRLTIQGLRRDVDNGEQRHYHVMEIDYGSFERTVKVPKDVDHNKMEAVYKDGFLEIRLAKASKGPGGIVHIEVHT